MKKALPASVDAIAEIKTELADYERQRGEAQQQLAVWRDKALMADAAHQACAALLKKLDVVQPTDVT